MAQGADLTLTGHGKKIIVAKPVVEFDGDEICEEVRIYRFYHHALPITNPSRSSSARSSNFQSAFQKKPGVCC